MLYFLDSYYRNLPIKPGVHIYKAIVESKLPFSRLQVKIPETLATFDTLYWIDYDYEKGVSYMKELENWNSPPRLNDRNQITPSTSYKGFVDNIEFVDTIYYNHLQVDRALDPAAISRSWSTFPVSESIDVLSWDKLRQVYSFGPNADGVLQRFIYSPTQKATLYRLIFHNPNNSNERSNYGYCITNKKNYFTPKWEIEARATHISENMNSFTVYNISGKTIKDFETYAYNLCIFLERSYSIKIERIVWDFVKDELGNIFFVNVKSFRLVHAELYNQLAAMSQTERAARKLEIKERSDKTNNTVQWQLCRINFRWVLQESHLLIL